MIVELRTIIYFKKFIIDHVPIYECKQCDRNELFPAVKADLNGLMADLDPNSSNQRISFDESNELAYLFKMVLSKQWEHAPIEQILMERTNELLDLLLLAQSLNDEKWTDQIRSRLKQLSNYAISFHDL
jgi:hypothetical protein